MDNSTVKSKQTDKPTGVSLAEDFSERHVSNTMGTGTNNCLCTVTIEHKDNLGRPLPDGIAVILFDEIRVCRGVIKDGISTHLNVRCGNVFWQFSRLSSPKLSETTYKRIDNRSLTDNDESIDLSACDGYMLIKANDKASANPRLQLVNPLKVFVSVNEPKITAVYTPPPMICNLRFRQNEQPSKLSDHQIDTIQQNGNNVTLFIHGYNVPLGEMGLLAELEDWNGKEAEAYHSSIPFAKDLQRPFLHHSREDIAHLFNQQDDDGLKPSYKALDEEYNGHSALSWIPRVEHYLNLAASGKNLSDQLTDWDDFSRIVGVTWSGSISSGLKFSQSEMYANEAGRSFALVLKDLIDRGIKINIITHSLGARVALSALNILGDMQGYKDKVDNLFMWQAAIADNALTNINNFDENPVDMGVFPYAHAVAKTITVLHSTEDGVLGKDKKWGDKEPTGILGGAYPKKYTILASGTKPIKEYYDDSIDEIVRNIDSCRKSNHVQPALFCEAPKKSKQYQETVGELIKSIRAEAKAVNAHSGIAELIHLRPWSHYRRFTDEQIDNMIKVLTDSIKNNWDSRDWKVRPALGHQGNIQVILGQGKSGPDAIDPFLSALDKSGKFRFINQSTYFMSHSAMRDYEIAALDKEGYFPEIYEKSYRIGIADEIKRTSNFGSY